MKQLLNECETKKVFSDDENKNECEEEEEKEMDNVVPVIMVGPLANYYGDFVDVFCKIYNEDENGFKVKFVNEYVQNEGTVDVIDRSSALQQVLQSVVTPEAISNFESIADIKSEIMDYKPLPKKVEDKTEPTLVTEESEETNKAEKTKKKKKKKKKKWGLF